MSVRITVHCSGCDATAPAGRIKREFRSFSGRDHGFGVAHDEIEWKTPEGWVAFDPYTYATYCPECWNSINAEAELEGEK